MRKEAFTTENKPHDQLAAIRQNDEAALKVLYQENYAKVESYVLANNGTEDDAKDVYQEAFIAVWRNIQLGKFTPKGETSLGGYLYQVARYKWLDQLRASYPKKLVPLDSADLHLVLADGLPDGQQAYLEAVKKAFAGLGANCRHLLQRFYFGKESLRSLAAAFNWTEATAKNNKYRCLQQLRERIKTQ